MFNRLTPSLKIFSGLILTYALLAAIGVFLPQNELVPMQQLPLPKPLFALIMAVGILIIYGSFGFIGLSLSKKIGFPDVWDETHTSKQRFLIPAIAGFATGIFFVLIDIVLSKFHSLGHIPHPPFPMSLVATISAGIGEEVMFRLFFISFWVWLISQVLLKGRGQSIIFWIVVVWSAIAFTAAHVPAVMYLFHLNSPTEIPVALTLELFLGNGAITFVAAYFLRKYGLLSAIAVHICADAVWHVVWGIM